MLEKLRYKSVPMLLTLGLGLTACGGHTDGISGLDLLDCEKGPKKNTLTLDTLQKGASFTLAKSVYSDNHARLGDGVTLTARNNGTYDLRLDTGSVNVGDDVFFEVERPDDPISTTLRTGETATYSEGGESYEITANVTDAEGQPQPQLVVIASCDG